MQAAEAGNDPLAQFTLGDIHRYGEGVVANPFEAFRWYILAAEQTLPEAEFIVGLWLADGIGAPENDFLALSWLRKAAAQGMTDAFYELGSMYAEGEGISTDLQQAYVWYSVAVELGLVRAQNQRDTVASMLEAQQLETARQDVRQCIASELSECE